MTLVSATYWSRHFKSFRADQGTNVSPAWAGKTGSEGVGPHPARCCSHRPLPLAHPPRHTPPPRRAHSWVHTRSEPRAHTVYKPTLHSNVNTMCFTQTSSCSHVSMQSSPESSPSLRAHYLLGKLRHARLPEAKACTVGKPGLDQGWRLTCVCADMESPDSPLPPAAWFRPRRCPSRGDPRARGCAGAAGKPGARECPLRLSPHTPRPRQHQGVPGQGSGGQGRRA